MHAPGLGPGQRCVPAHTPDSVSFIITVHPPAVSFPSKSPERRIVLVARSVHKRQLWLAGRQAGRRGSSCSYPSCPASRSFSLRLVPSCRLVSFSLLDCCLLGQPSESWRQQPEIRPRHSPRSSPCSTELVPTSRSALGAFS